MMIGISSSDINMPAPVGLPAQALPPSPVKVLQRSVGKRYHSRGRKLQTTRPPIKVPAASNIRCDESRRKGPHTFVK